MRTRPPSSCLARRDRSDRYNAFCWIVAFLEDFCPYFLHSKIADRSTIKKTAYYPFNKQLVKLSQLKSVHCLSHLAEGNGGVWSQRPSTRKAHWAYWTLDGNARSNAEPSALQTLHSAGPLLSALSNKPPMVLKSRTPV